MDDPLDFIFWRDEILQILYWFQGEGFGEVASPGDLVPFLEADEAFIRQQLVLLTDEGYVRCAEGLADRFELTELGRCEGARRFADEFAGLTNQAHGECDDPKCACRTEGPQACTARNAHAH